MKIYTSYFGNHRNYRQCGIPISIAYYYPSDYNYKKFKNFVSSKEILYLSWEKFTPIYQKILSRLNPDIILAKLEKLSRGQDIVLLCWEKDPSHCHRTLVADWLQEHTGTFINEVGKFYPFGDGVDIPPLIIPDF